MTRWQKTRLKFLAAEPITNGVGEKGEHEETAWPRYIRTTDILGPRSLRPDTFKSLPLVIARRATVRRGDLLMTAAGATIGKSYLHDSDVPACYAGYLVRFRHRSDVDPRFIAYWTESHPYWQQIEVGAVKATIENFSAGKYRNLELSVPSLEEQRAIVDFLDRETARVDDLIQRKRRLTDLLRKRIATISADLVRRSPGANRLTDSGIPAVGNVPSHWDVCRNKNILSEVQELSESGEEELLSVSHLTGVTPRSEKVYMFMAASLVGYKKVRPGDLVINTMWAWMGALGVSSTTGLVSPGYGVYRFNTTKALPSFFDLFYRTPAYVMEMTRFSRGIWNSRLRLYPDVFLGLRTVVPPLAEQETIVAAVRESTQESRKLVHSLEESIGFLLKRREALITAAVTGEAEFPGTAA